MSGTISTFHLRAQFFGNTDRRGWSSDVDILAAALVGRHDSRARDMVGADIRRSAFW